MLSNILWGLTYIPTVIFRGWALALVWNWHIGGFLTFAPLMTTTVGIGIVCLSGVVTPPISDSLLVKKLIDELAVYDRWHGAMTNLVLSVVSGYVLLLAFILTKV